MAARDACREVKRHLDLLDADRRLPDREPDIAGVGIYVLYLNQATSLPGIQVAPGGTLYVGMTEDDIGARYHFGHKDSSFSSPRRSLGAILKNDLGLRAIPRSLNRSRKDMLNYRFANGGEERLTEWMLSLLEYSVAQINRDISDVEKQLIQCLEPPLNLTLWINWQCGLVIRLRRICAEEAAGVKIPSGVTEESNGTRLHNVCFAQEGAHVSGKLRSVERFHPLPQIRGFRSKLRVLDTDSR
jgi:hypothetical protein